MEVWMAWMMEGGRDFRADGEHNIYYALTYTTK